MYFAGCIDQFKKNCKSKANKKYPIMNLSSSAVFPSELVKNSYHADKEKKEAARILDYNKE